MVYEVTIPRSQRIINMIAIVSSIFHRPVLWALICTYLTVISQSGWATSKRENIRLNQNDISLGAYSHKKTYKHICTYQEQVIL